VFVTGRKFEKKQKNRKLAKQLSLWVYYLSSWAISGRDILQLETESNELFKKNHTGLVENAESGWIIISEIKQTTFLSTRTLDYRGETGLKTAFVSVCGNPQHIWQNRNFLKFFAFLHERYDALMPIFGWRPCWQKRRLLKLIITWFSPPPKIFKSDGRSGGWMPLIITLVRNMATAFWWQIIANHGVAAVMLFWLSRHSVCGYITHLMRFRKPLLWENEFHKELSLCSHQS
jgi:hypothetical protein